MAFARAKQQNVFDCTQSSTGLQLMLSSGRARERTIGWNRYKQRSWKWP